MPALNHAIMLPGLIIVAIIFWAWVPIWAILWCLRGAKSPHSDEEKLQSGQVPHSGFQPPKSADYILPLHMAHLKYAASVPPRMQTQNSNNNAAQVESYGEEYSVSGDEEAWRQYEVSSDPSLKAQQRQERYARCERVDSWRKDKGKGRASPISWESIDTSSAVTAPEHVVTRDSSRHYHSRR